MATTMSVLGAFDSLGLCHFCLQIGDPPFLPWLHTSTGWDMDEADSPRVGQRIQALRHAFNTREGVTPSHTILPARERGDPALNGGALAEIILDTEAMAST